MYYYYSSYYYQHNNNKKKKEKIHHLYNYQAVSTDISENEKNENEFRQMQQRVYDHSGLRFAANFDSGNLTSVTPLDEEVKSDLEFERFELDFGEDNESTAFKREGNRQRAGFISP